MKRITWVTAVLVFLLAAGAFAMSFESLRGLAKDNGLPFPAIFPLIVEGFIIVASLAWLRASMQNERAVYPIALIGLATVVSVAFNIVHAPPTALARIMYSVPPVALLLSFELLMSQLKSNMKPQATRVDIKLIQRNTELQDELAAMQERLGAVQAHRQRLQDQLAVLQEKPESGIPAQLGPLGRDILRLIAGDEGITAKQIAAAHEISESKVSRLKADLNGGVAG